MVHKRPLIITIICTIWVIAAVLSFPGSFSVAAKSIGSWYPPYSVFSLIVGFVGVIGLWMMKKWGLILYTTISLISQFVLIFGGLWNIFTLLVPSIVIIIGFLKFKEME